MSRECLETTSPCRAMLALPQRHSAGRIVAANVEAGREYGHRCGDVEVTYGALCSDEPIEPVAPRVRPG